MACIYMSISQFLSVVSSVIRPCMGRLMKSCSTTMSRDRGDHGHNLQSCPVPGSSPKCCHGPLCLHNAQGFVHTRAAFTTHPSKAVSQDVLRYKAQYNALLSSCVPIYLPSIISLTFFLSYFNCFIPLLVSLLHLCQSAPLCSLWNPPFECFSSESVLQLCNLPFPAGLCVRQRLMGSRSMNSESKMDGTS